MNRPAQLAIVSPIGLIVSFYASIVHGCLYIAFTTMSEVFQVEYGFSQGAVGLTYLGLGKYLFLSPRDHINGLYTRRWLCCFAFALRKYF